MIDKGYSFDVLRRRATSYDDEIEINQLFDKFHINFNRHYLSFSNETHVLVAESSGSMYIFVHVPSVIIHFHKLHQLNELIYRSKNRKLRDFMT